MKVVHIESGLGNQMLSYCEYLVLKKLHPNEDIYIEDIVYDIPEVNKVIKQWNGYELERIFGIHAPNVKELFPDEQWKAIMAEVKTSEFWLKNWNYPVYITRALNHAGLKLKNIRGDFESAGAIKNVNMLDHSAPSLKQRLIDTRIGNALRRWYRLKSAKKRIASNTKHDEIFYKGDDDIFTGQWLGLKTRNLLNLLTRNFAQPLLFRHGTAKKTERWLNFSTPSTPSLFTPVAGICSVAMLIATNMAIFVVLSSTSNDMWRIRYSCSSLTQVA